MTVIELEPVTAADAAAFLERGAVKPDGPTWHLIADEIKVPAGGPARPGPVEPLMASVIRSAYAGQAEAAAALAAHGDAAAIENEILDALVFARFHEHATSEIQRLRRPVSAADADSVAGLPRCATGPRAHLRAELAAPAAYVSRLQHPPALGGPGRCAGVDHGGDTIRGEPRHRRRSRRGRARRRMAGTRRRARGRGHLPGGTALLSGGHRHRAVAAMAAPPHPDAAADGPDRPRRVRT